MSERIRLSIQIDAHEDIDRHREFLHEAALEAVTNALDWQGVDWDSAYASSQPARRWWRR